MCGIRLAYLLDAYNGPGHVMRLPHLRPEASTNFDVLSLHQDFHPVLGKDESLGSRLGC